MSSLRMKPGHTRRNTESSMRAHSNAFQNGPLTNERENIENLRRKLQGIHRQQERLSTSSIHSDESIGSQSSLVRCYSGPPPPHSIGVPIECTPSPAIPSVYFENLLDHVATSTQSAPVSRNTSNMQNRKHCGPTSHRHRISQPHGRMDEPSHKYNAEKTGTHHAFPDSARSRGDTAHVKNELNATTRNRYSAKSSDVYHGVPSTAARQEAKNDVKKSVRDPFSEKMRSTMHKRIPQSTGMHLSTTSSFQQ
uniref:AlNc14C40G3472 protein n=1 Tax=Albugo laibachii Nc14 TaxID=890382 RepID=F0W9L7_9STRA|nr:AlNc14C40G3472 [Albugo laibachii Nc14]|eukprot:CCA17835.1 AlNc14C40G3472 [Albugo laibachii Nc14]